MGTRSITDDPFDEADDEFLGSYQFEEPPLKKLREDDGFDDDDEFLLNAADELEKTLEDVSSQKHEFKTWIGRPHPLLLPEVLEKVMGYIKDGKTLSTCRLVSTAWYDAATVHWSSYNVVQNVNHVIEPYPYGLSYSSETRNFETEFEFPGITNLKIADPCQTFTRPIVGLYFNSHGHVLKSFAFDANFWCMDHVTLLVSVVFEWCTNLEDLKLINATNRTVMNYYTMYPAGYFTNKRIRLKTLSVTTTSNEMEHHHYSTRNRVNPSFEFLLSQGARNDGGILGKIVHAAETLQSISITSNYSNPVLFLRSGVLPNLRSLEVNGGTLHRSDVNKIRGVRLSTLKIGPVRDLSNEFRRLLKHQAPSLTALELFGEAKGQPASENLSIRFPDLSLKSLVIHDGSSIKIRSTACAIKLPHLKHLEVHSDCTNANVLSTLKRLEHHGINTLKLTGRCCYASLNISAWFPNVTALTITVLGDNSFNTLLEKVSKLEHLESLTIVFTACNSKNIAAYTREHVPKIKSLKQLTLSFLGFNNLVPFGIADFNAFVLHSKLRTLQLANYAIHDDEAEELANMLAEALVSATFKTCRIQPRRVMKNYHTLPLNDILLCKFSLKPLVKLYFHALQ
ncbi:Volume-regulated anion channel subunit LRRC8E [Orchesella cincta]|uniref:Volume-regulated anion channel subunit LRRC8E n=1 Tax=Orchesella cincta TaxID=48709 RepID=A0A1D2NHV4_ORCCI|nr:Volume-regulated anion channel subunit LRRC8E [Orchesella cincta]